MRKIAQIFVCFSESLNFTNSRINIQLKLPCIFFLKVYAQTLDIKKTFLGLAENLFSFSLSPIHTTNDHVMQVCMHARDLARNQIPSARIGYVFSHATSIMYCILYHEKNLALQDHKRENQIRTSFFLNLQFHVHLQQ